MIEAIIRKVVPNGRITRTWPLKGGIVAEMTAVEAEDGDGRVRKLVVRRHETAVYEYQVLDLTGALGLGTAVPYLLDESGDVPALVMGFIEGGINFGLKDVDGYVRQMAGALARVHSADFAGRDVSFLKRRPAECMEFGRVRPYLGADGLAGGVDVGRVEAVLGRGLPGPGNEARLLHGDFWAGNMLWRDGVLVGVVDWEDAGLGDPLKDLGEARVELVWLFGVEAAERFLAHYRSMVTIDYSNLPYWDLCAVLRLLRLTKGDWGWLVDFAGQHGRGDLTAAGIGAAFGEFVEGALVDLSFVNLIG